jgi:Tol biopolymer transport system component
MPGGSIAMWHQRQSDVKRRPSRSRRLTALGGRRAAGLLIAASILAWAAPAAALAKAPGTNGPIAFDAFDAGGTGHLVVVNQDGSGRHEVPLPWPGGLPVWSPDGTELAVSVFVGDGPPRPATIRPDGSDPHLLEFPMPAPDFALICRAWSPDGGRLLCQGDSVEQPDVRAVYSLLSADGTDLTRLSWGAFPPVFTDRGTCGAGDLPGDYSPDGSRFVFTRAKCGAGPTPDRNQNAALFVANADGSALRQLTPFGSAWSHDDGLARWSPDGASILFAGAHGNLFTVGQDGGHLRQIPLDEGDGRVFAVAPDWAPDGTRIVFDLFVRASGAVAIYTSRPDGGDLRRISDEGGFVDDANWQRLP